MAGLVCFAHGKESGPWGRKITRLAGVAEGRGWAVESPDFQFTYDPAERRRHLEALLRDDPRRPLVLAGSSMGGHVVAFADQALRADGLFLMAPALYLPGYPGEPAIQAPHVSVVHGWDDELIPPAHAWRFAQRHRAACHLVDADHGLASALGLIEPLFATLLDAVAAAADP